MQWLRDRVQRLPFRLRSGEAPDMPLGTRVLVFKGEARNDAGQMAIVSGLAGSQVEISYCGPQRCELRPDRSSGHRLYEWRKG